MNTILIYLHLVVMFLTGVFFINVFEHPVLKTFGVLNITFAIVCAYIYATSSLWQVWMI